MPTHSRAWRAASRRGSTPSASLRIAGNPLFALELTRAAERGDELGAAAVADSLAN